MGEPSIFRWMGGLSRLLGDRLLRVALGRFFVPFIFKGEAPKRKLRAALQRIRRFQGKPADEAALDGLVDELLAFYAYSLANLCYLCRSLEDPRTAVPVRLDILPKIEALRRYGRGVILATPHFGDLYSAIPALAQAGVPLHVLMVGGENYRWIERPGLHFHPLLTGAAPCLKALRANEAILLYDDLDYFPGGRTAEFFGAPIFPPHGPARMALASEAPILPLYSVLDQGVQTVQGDEPLFPLEGVGQDQLEAELLRSMERFIGAHPEQWLTFEDIWDLEAIRERNRRLFPQAARQA